MQNKDKPIRKSACPQREENQNRCDGTVVELAEVYLRTLQLETVCSVFICCEFMMELNQLFDLHCLVMTNLFTISYEVSNLANGFD